MSKKKNPALTAAVPQASTGGGPISITCMEAENGWVIAVNDDMFGNCRRQWIATGDDVVAVMTRLLVTERMRK